MKLNAKILFYILTTTVLLFISSIGFISFKSKDRAFEDSKIIVNSYVREYANQVKYNLDVEIDISRTMAQTFLGYKNISPDIRQPIYNDILRNVFIENHGFIAVWTSWELEAFGKNYTKSHGRIRTEVFERGGQVMVKQDSLEMDTYDPEMQYYQVKRKKEEIITEPYYYSYSGKKEDEILETSLCVPIVEEDEFIGLTGIDMPLERYQTLIGNIKPYENSFAYFLSNEGRFIAHPDKNHINEKISEVMAIENAKYKIDEKIKKGETFSFITNSINGKASYASFAPVTIGRSKTPWSIGVVVPIEEVMKDANNNFKISIFAGILGMIILTVVTLSIARYITKPLQRITKILKNLARGDISETKEMAIRSNDEIGQIRNSVNVLVAGLRRTALFANAIERGNLDSHFRPLSENDVLGSALLEMRKSLKEAKLEDKRRKEADENQNWATRGYAKFGEILRHNNDNVEDFGYELINNLVKYLGASQGGFFLINDIEENNQFIELIAAYAYDRKKHDEKKINIGVGLVGRCVLEKMTIYMTDIPENYMRITSGLGDENPTSLLIIPMKVNDQVMGVLELASFKEIPSHQIEFIEKIGESIAATVSNIKTNLRTSRLLLETKAQSEALAEHEESLNQHMQELRKAQEESEKREAEMSALWKTVNSYSLITELDINGNILKMNPRAISAFNLNDKEIKNLSIKNIVVKTELSEEENNLFWEEIRHGKIKRRVIFINSSKNLWISETYSPIFDNEGKITKILNIGVDITESKKQELFLKNQIEELKKAAQK